MDAKTCPRGTEKVKGKCVQKKGRFEEGEKVLYYGSWGKIEPVMGTITEIDSKQGRRVYVVDLDVPKKKKDSRWGYTYQFKKVPPSSQSR